MDEIEVPPYFMCPISLEMMKDPVTTSTGITYDREHIEKWIFGLKNNSCPVSKQRLMDDTELTPNVTLRRLIQSWCTLNASHGIERFPTPKPPVNKPQILKLLNDAKSPEMLTKCLQRLTCIASENEANKRCMESAGVAAFLASTIVSYPHAREEALSILYTLKLSDQGLRSLLMVSGNGELIESLTQIMQRGSYESRAYAVMLMNDMFGSSSIGGMSLKAEFFIQVVQVLREEISRKGSKAALQLLVNVCPLGRNRVKAAEAGAVRVLVDLLLDSSEKRASELMLTLLDQVCQCAEGRAELINHAAGLAIVSKKILRVSKVASERAIKVLHSVSKYSAAPSSVVQEMLNLGVVAKLCLVLQVDCGSKNKERARDILKLHAKAWRGSPCIPINLASSYPF